MPANAAEVGKDPEVLRKGVGKGEFLERMKGVLSSLSLRFITHYEA